MKADIDMDLSEKEQQLAAVENQEWLDSLDYVLRHSGANRSRELLRLLAKHAGRQGMRSPFVGQTPYVNTIHRDQQPTYPGDLEMEKRIRSLIRWNAAAMVVRANRTDGSLGGHISTYASSATLLDVGFNHFFRGHTKDEPGDIIYFQGHASPGIYARAFLEGRLTENHLINFRRELQPSGGLSSYPHPWLMPDFWEFPTVSMGLSPMMSIYQARFNRYLEARGLKAETDRRVWAFFGDGEFDEPESLGAITLPTREKLNNLVWVINCNLQRLDGPVRGNGKIIQELEGIFRGAGWNVNKVIWGGDWDPLLAQDHQGLLAERMNAAVDGDYQKYSVESGDYLREKFFGTDPQLIEMVAQISDTQLKSLKRGGHDAEKVFAAYANATEQTDRPTVILAKTVKGYGMGESGEGKNIAHQQKKLSHEELLDFRDRFDVPLTDKDVAEARFIRPKENSPEMRYLKERRQSLGGPIPSRRIRSKALTAPKTALYEEFYTGSAGREVSTTMVLVRILTKLLRDKEFGKWIVPIIPDEARTFGMEGLFRQFGIYSQAGQLYEPVDASSLLYYREAKDGQILEEGINEAGSMCSFIAAGTAYSSHGINTIPFFIFYSMFGFQRVGDFIWAAADMRTRGFLVGGTAGRTTLNGEGLQHQDGHSHLIAYSVPNVLAYDPAFAYEIAVIVEEGIRRMYEKEESIFYYLTVGNENYDMPTMPEGRHIKEGILKGLYKFSASSLKTSQGKANLFGSGALLKDVIKAADLLESKFDVSCDVWSITSYKELYRDGIETDRWNLLNPNEPEKSCYIEQALAGSKGVYVMASDYVKAMPNSISRWFPKRPVGLGTDGFGRSETREALRDFFEVDHRYIVLATLVALLREKKVTPRVVQKAMQEFDIDAKKLNPMIS